MTLVCIGWGSLIWDARDLPVIGDWKADGPALPVELARESNDGRITLVLVENATPTPTFWVELDVSTLAEAKTVLARREGVSDQNIRYSIGYWNGEDGSRHGREADAIAQWAAPKRLTGVVWTNLKFGLKGSRDKMPTYEEIWEHFESLDSDARSKAEAYVRRAPKQVCTSFRKRLADELNWHPIDA